MAGTPKTVLHGMDQSVADFYKLPDRGHHATLCLQEDLQHFWIYNPAEQNWHPFEYVCFVYDYAEDGGAIGFHNLDIELPENTLIMDGCVDVVDTITSAGAATIGIKVQSAVGSTEDILAAAVLGTNGTMGLHDIVPNGSAANAIRVTTDKQVKLDVRVAVLTSGTLYGYLRCFRGFELLTSSASSVSSSTSSASSSSSSSVSSSSSSASTSSSASSSSSHTESESSLSVSSASSASGSSSSSQSASESSASSATASSSSSSSSSESSGSSSSYSSSSSSAQTG